MLRFRSQEATCVRSRWNEDESHEKIARSNLRKALNFLPLDDRE